MYMPYTFRALYDRKSHNAGIPNNANVQIYSLKMSEDVGILPMNSIRLPPNHRLPSTMSLNKSYSIVKYI